MPADFDEPESVGSEGAPMSPALPPDISPWAGPQGPYPAPVPSRPPRLAAEDVAAQLAESGASAFLALSMHGVFAQADAQAYKAYRDRLVAGCGTPSDPVEVMLI